LALSRKFFAKLWKKPRILETFFHKDHQECHKSIKISALPDRSHPFSPEFIKKNLENFFPNA